MAQDEKYSEDLDDIPGLSPRNNSYESDSDSEDEKTNKQEIDDSMEEFERYSSKQLHSQKIDTDLSALSKETNSAALMACDKEFENSTDTTETEAKIKMGALSRTIHSGIREDTETHTS